MSHIRSTALVSGAALLAAVLLAPPSAADRYTEGDRAGDMRVMAPVTGETSPAPTHRKLDLRRVTVRHTDHFVSIRAATRALARPRGDESFDLFGFVKVNRRAQPSEGVAWTYEVEFNRSRPREGEGLFVLDATHQEEFGCADFRNPRLKARANYDRRWVTVIIPRRCLAPARLRNVRPQWVRVSVEATHSLGLDRRGWFDHLGSQALPDPSLTTSHFTPRLFPG